MISLFQDHGGFQVWTDTGVGEQDGRCIGCDDHNRLKALRDAEKELESDLAQVRKLIENTSPTD